jgi:DNA-directed RNA polymerase alpha subunit
MIKNPAHDEEGSVQILNAKEYFMSKRLEGGSLQQIYVRISMALSRRGEITMEQLCAMTEDEMRKIRGIGAKSHSLIQEECVRYKARGH